ncbi:uncharacterized protein LOC134772298 [Penaeus indicus]|uniref:uncharacterized protein LOC134772298 n=1 Tax=Penaeus indicus TaxID=29960 RepID=UPI00300D9A46
MKESVRSGKTHERLVGVILLLVGVWAASVRGEYPEEKTEQRPEKRQIYRESVLPAKGGVIPQGALSLQRLQHNAHDSVGIEAPDGVIYVPRSTDIRPGRPDPEDEQEILTLTPEVHLQPSLYDILARPQPQPTTYLLRRPVGENLLSPRPQHYEATPISPPVATPISPPLAPPTLYAHRIPWAWYSPPPSFFLGGLATGFY